MIEPNKELLSKFVGFQRFMQTDKYVSNVIVIKEKKPQHTTSLEYNEVLNCTQPFGKSYISIEVRNGDPFNFSAKLMTDEISNKILLRYDSAGAAHRNNIEGIPLNNQIVTTPHIHRYDNQGRLIAEKTEAILKNQKAASDIQTGFSIFCLEGRIKGKTIKCPQVHIGDQPVLPFEMTMIDPCDGVPF